MNRVFRSLFMILLSAAFLLTGCAEDSQNTASDNKRYSYNFVFVCPIMDNEHWQTCIDGVKRADDDSGTSTKIIGSATAENFTSELPGYMRQAIESRPDGIIAYSGLNNMSRLIDEAVAEGIPVISIDGDAPETSRAAYVGSDEYNLGYDAGTELVGLTDGRAKVGILISSESSSHEMAVVSAFKDAVADYDIDIVAFAETNADIDKAVSAADEMLKSHPEITAAFCTMACNVTGFGRVKKELRRNNLVLVGFDDTDENLELTSENVINALFVQQTELMGYQSVTLMKELVDNGTLPNQNYYMGTVLYNSKNIGNYYSNKSISEQHETVKIGYYNSASVFQDGYSDSERKSGYAYEYYQALVPFTNWDYEYIYGSREDILDKLAGGEVDIVAGIYNTDYRAEQFLFSACDMGIDGEARYFAVNKNRNDLLVSLDRAVEQLHQSQPDFELLLREKYYHRNKNEQLTKSEREWLEGKTLKIGYLKHNLPFSDMDGGGNPTGLAGDLIQRIKTFLNVEVEAVCFETMPDMEEALKSNEVNVIFPTYSDLWLNESKGFMQTDSFISDRIMIVYSGKYENNLMNRVAVCETGLSRKYYPDSELVYYETNEKMFDAVNKGKEKCAVGCSSVFQRFLVENPKYDNLNIAYLESNQNFGMAVNHENSRLVVILNKAIRQVDNATLMSSIIHYSGVSPDFSIEMFIKQNAILVVMGLVLFIALLIVFFIYYRKKNRLFNEEQEETQKKLKKALEQANSANKAKTTFLSSMSHDIRTPMNAIAGMSAIAINHIDERERVKDCLEKIDTASRHLLTLINDVLDISKIESGSLALTPVVFSLENMITTIVNIVRPQFMEKEINFSAYIHNMPYEMVIADEVRVNQILINILSNAIKYTNNGGKVTVDLYEEYHPGTNSITLTYIVEDNGIGMSHEFMLTMYNTFSRAKDTRISKVQGTGLGLAIVRQIVDIMDGSIDCESEENKGTKFTIKLDMPLAEYNQEKHDLSGISILVVDDDEKFLQTLSEMLSGAGAEVETASCGTTAVELVGSNDYSVCIVDRFMPEMDGFETIRAIRKINGTLPVIMASSYDLVDAEEQGGGLDISGFIIKPLFLSAICSKINTILNKPVGDISDEKSDENNLFSNMTFLVAEDNEINWEVISELLLMYNIKSVHAENGRICVDMLNAAEDGEYDAVLMDIQMPEMNGREAARVIRQSKRQWVRMIPIVAMTADAFAEDIKACMAAGIDGHVSKPVDMDNLFQELSKIIKKQ